MIPAKGDRYVGLVYPYVGMTVHVLDVVERHARVYVQPSPDAYGAVRGVIDHYAGLDGVNPAYAAAAMCRATEGRVELRERAWFVAWLRAKLARRVP